MQKQTPLSEGARRYQAAVQNGDWQTVKAMKAAAAATRARKKAEREALKALGIEPPPKPLSKKAALEAQVAAAEVARLERVREEDEARRFQERIDAGEIRLTGKPGDGEYETLYEPPAED